MSEEMYDSEYDSENLEEIIDPNNNGIVHNFNILSREQKIELLEQIARRTRNLANLHKQCLKARTQEEENAISRETSSESIDLVFLLNDFGIAIPTEEILNQIEEEMSNNSEVDMDSEGV